MALIYRGNDQKDSEREGDYHYASPWGIGWLGLVGAIFTGTLSYLWIFGALPSEWANWDTLTRIGMVAFGAPAQFIFIASACFIAVAVYSIFKGTEVKMRRARAGGEWFISIIAIPFGIGVLLNGISRGGDPLAIGFSILVLVFGLWGIYKTFQRR